MGGINYKIFNIHSAQGIFMGVLIFSTIKGHTQEKTGEYCSNTRTVNDDIFNVK